MSSSPSIRGVVVGGLSIGFVAGLMQPDCTPAVGQYNTSALSAQMRAGVAPAFLASPVTGQRQVYTIDWTPTDFCKDNPFDTLCVHPLRTDFPHNFDEIKKLIAGAIAVVGGYKFGQYMRCAVAPPSATFSTP